MSDAIARLRAGVASMPDATVYRVCGSDLRALLDAHDGLVAALAVARADERERAAGVAELRALDCDMNADDATEAEDEEDCEAWEDMAALARDIAGDIRKPACAACGEPAACYGSYESAPSNYACDKCCGHSDEDGHCDALDASLTTGEE